MTQMHSVLTQNASMAANHSELLSQFRLLTDFVVGPYTDRENKTRDQLTELRKDMNVLKQQLRRQRLQHESGERQPSGVQVTNFMRPLPPNEAMFVMSFDSVAAENARRASRLNSANSAAHGTGQDVKISESEAVNGRNSMDHTYRNCGVQKVYVELPGPVSNRGCGGTGLSSAVIAYKAYTFFTKFISINTLSKALSDEIAMSATNASAQPTPRKGCDSRRKLDDSEKPVNLMGFMHRRTLTEGILASFMALDYYMRIYGWVKIAKVLCWELDGSAFNEKDMSGSILHMTIFEKDGVDAAGRQHMKIVTRSVSLTCLAIGDKISADVFRDDRSMFQKEVPCQMVVAMAMSGNMSEIFHHPCMYLNVDKGSETRGTGKGRRGSMLRNAFFGKGSPLEQIWGTGEAIEGVMNGENGPALQKYMEFFNVPQSQRYLHFQKRRLPRQLKLTPDKVCNLCPSG